jgi:hypothetical protein
MAITWIFVHMKTIGSVSKLELKYLIFTIFSNNRLTFEDKCYINNITFCIHLREIQYGTIYCLYSNHLMCRIRKRKKTLSFFLT